MTRHTKRYSLLSDYHLLSYDALDSTNEEAKRLAQGGASHGAVVWARRQTHGKGRAGREWVSEPGNLFVSFLLSPKCDLKEAAQLSFVASVAVAGALAQVLPAASKLSLKWPNDILLGDKKLGGILLESFTTPSEKPKGKPKTWIVVGVGVNVDSAPDGVALPAACLKESGVELISAKIVLVRLINHFIAQYNLWQEEGFAPVRKAWLARAGHLGKKIEVKLGEEIVKGTFEGIGKDGALEIASRGKKRSVYAGEVFF